MSRFSQTVFQTMLAAVVGASVAAAQTPANVTVVQGSGQLVCTQCSNLGDVFLSPVAVRVTDAGGNPIVGATVSWSINGAASASITPTSITDSDGDALATAFIPSSQLFVGFSTYYNQATVVAAAGNASVSFPITNSLTAQNSGLPGVTYLYTQPLTTFSGTVGGAGTPFTVQVTSSASTPVSGISVRLINWIDGTSGPSTTSPSAYCQTGAAVSGLSPDPWSVLTDSTGSATCTPVLGPVAGSGQIAVLIGGTPAGVWVNGKLLNPDMITYNPTAVLPQTPLPGFGGSGAVGITVTQASVGGIKIVSGNNQSAAPGQTLQLLQATVTDSSGNGLPSQPVTWAVSPPGTGTLANPSAASDSSGHVSATLTLSTSAAGTVTVTVKSVNNPSASASFTETSVPLITITALQKVGGDGQTAVEGAAFAMNLVVQATVNSGSLANQAVTFAVTGGAATLTSPATTTTSGNGQAQVSVRAGATPGAVTITATAGSAIVTFTLTVTPPLPPISATSFVNAADSKAGSISPCSLATIVASGLMLEDAVAGIGMLPYQVDGLTIGFSSGDLAPIQSILTNSAGQTSITFEVPCDQAAGTVPVAVNINGNTVAPSVTLLAASPGIYSTVMSDGKARAVIVRPDGSFVSLTNPARRGENVTAYVTGLGPVSPGIGTNGLPIPGTPSVVQGQMVVGVNNAGVLVNSAQLSEDRIAVYEVFFQIPSNTAQGNDVPFSVAVIPVGSTTAIYSNGSSIPIQ